MQGFRQEILSLADPVGDYIFTDEKFVRNLYAGDRNVFQKVFDEIKYLCKIVYVKRYIEKAKSEISEQIKRLKRRGKHA